MVLGRGTNTSKLFLVLALVYTVARIDVAWIRASLSQARFARIESPRIHSRPNIHWVRASTCRGLDRRRCEKRGLSGTGREKICELQRRTPAGGQPHPATFAREDSASTKQQARTARTRPCGRARRGSARTRLRRGVYADMDREPMTRPTT